jgi:hypothetical protein
MSFLGLLNVEHPYCPICGASVHADYVLNELRMADQNSPEEEQPVEYKCIKCGTEMLIEGFGCGIYNVYPDEDTIPENMDAYL